MTLSDIKPKMRVAYVPRHAHGNLAHPDVEHGEVSSVNSLYAFVKFDKYISAGWDNITAQACDPADLVAV